MQLGRGLLSQAEVGEGLLLGCGGRLPGSFNLSYQATSAAVVAVAVVAVAVVAVAVAMTEAVSVAMAAAMVLPNRLDPDGCLNI